MTLKRDKEVSKGDEAHARLFVFSLEWEDVRILWAFIPKGVLGRGEGPGLITDLTKWNLQEQAAENQGVCLSKQLSPGSFSLFFSSSSLSLRFSSFWNESAAVVRSPQSCVTLCSPLNCSTPGSHVASTVSQSLGKICIPLISVYLTNSLYLPSLLSPPSFPVSLHGK